MAELIVCFVYPDGRRVPGRIAIDRPVWDSDKEASCSVALEGIQSVSMRIHGSSTLQALILAAQFVATRLYGFYDQGGQIVFAANEAEEVPVRSIFGALWRGPTAAAE